MTAPTIAEYLKYAHLQMAAEAFIRDEKTNRLDNNGVAYVNALISGNDHSSRFVASQADKFTGEWEVLDQRPNTKTGFSGTLFRNRETREVVLSLRSTEFIDDAARDNKATNELEIKETGFAWGQIADMQQWYAELKRDATKLGAGPAFSVTGYSLGGHLATVFNLLNAGAAERVVTFNGAGVGLVKNGTLQDALAEFNELRTSPDSLAARFTHPGLAAFYRRIQAELFSGQTTIAQAQADLNALYTDANTGVTVLGSQATTLMKALKGIETLGNEAVRVTTLVAGGSGEGASASPKPVLAKDIAGMDLNYRLAMLFASEHTQSASLVAGAVQGFSGKQYAGSLGNQYDVVGDTSPSVVANSQWHYGQDVRVGIEDQPLYRGGIGGAILRDLIALKSPDLLVNEYAVKDFGDTHSLVLLVDSLSLQNTLLSLMPEGERNAESVQSLLKTIYQAATNQKRVDGDISLGDSQGKAEGDLLEQMANALADMVLGPQDKAKQLKGNPSGGTWARTKDQDGYTGRDKFFEIVEAVQKKIKESTLGSQFKVLASTGRSLDGEARQSFGDYLALRLLSSFVLRTTDTPENVLEDMGKSWGAVYEDWKADKALLAQGGSAMGLQVSDQWLADRSAMLARKNWFNTENKEPFDLSYVAPNDERGAASPYQLEDTFFEDLTSGYKVRQGKITDATRHFLFGDDRENTLAGKEVVDHLYGDAGADTLDGKAGDDHLEGGTGDDILIGGTDNDTLVGGAGNDIYRFGTDWGVDFVQDSDGQGKIEVNGQVLTGGKQVSANAWQSEDKLWRYALTEKDDLIITHTSEPGRIVVRGWSKMKSLGPTTKAAGTGNPLGLDLPEFGGPQPPTPEAGRYALQGGYFVPGGPQLPGGTWQFQSDGSVPGMAPIQDSNDLMVGGENEPSGRYQRITGAHVDGEGLQLATYGEMGAVSLWGLGGNDFMSGEQFDDYLDGGDGDDLIWGGAGSDAVQGGAGNDIIVSNMAAVHDTFMENAVEPGDVRGPDTVFTYFGEQANFLGRWWVEKSEDGLSLKIPRAYVKNPDGGNTYWPEGEVDRDTVDAGEGDDYVWGGRGADYLLGGGGEDHLAGLGGGDVILGGEGKDLIYGDDWAAMRLAAVYDHDRDFGYLRSLPLDEALKSLALHGDDVIDAGADDDEVWGDGGSDVIFGGSGKDFLVGDALLEDLPVEYHGNDKLDGGDGDDTLFGFGKDDSLLGGEGDDELQGDSAQLDGGLHGKDSLDGGVGNDKLFGGGQNDTLTGGDGDDQLDGDSEAAALNGSFHGDDFLDGGDGNDALWGQGGSDIIHGGAGNDLIQADRDGGGLAANFHGKDFVDGGEGDDQISGGGGNDTLLGGEGNDVLAGEDEIDANSVSALAGDDQISGGAGNDTLFGGNGDDELSGGEGDDALYGGAGKDILEGGGGQDVLKGGAGDDTYRAAGDGAQIIVDTEGRNVVEGIDGLAAGANSQGDLVLSSGGRTVVLSEALLGGFSGNLSLGGQAMSLANYVGNAVIDPLTLVGHTDHQNMLGGRGEDEIFANGLSARIHAGKGSDRITLNSTGASILVSRGDGADRVMVSTPPSPGTPVADKVNLEFGEGISASDISFEYDGVNNVLKIRYSPEPDDVLEMTYGDMVPASVVDNPPVGEMRLADGSLVNIDFAPRVADEDAAFDFQVPANVFGSLGEGFAVSAKLANGQPLPDWLHFDAATRKFSGTPANGDVGSLNVQVLATKDQQATAAYTFALVVKNVNDAPIAGAALEEQVFMEGERWTYDLPADTFTDIDAGDVLTYSAQLADGKPLPDWLQIDPATGRLSTTRGLATRLNLSITATDQQGATAEQLVSLLVKSSMVDQGTNVVVGTSGDDVLVGTAGRDALVGGLGDDSLDGGPGDDELIGGNRVANSNQVSGTGRDTYLFGRGDGRDLISNGRGGADSLDTLKFKAGIKPEDIRVSRENLSIWAGDRFVPSDIRFTIKDTGESIRIPNFHALRGLGGEGVDVVTFEDYPNVVWDAAAIARLSLEGEASTDDIWGYFSDDVLRGNGGNDMLKGQLGNDIYQFGKNDGKDTIVEVANEGSDKIVFDQGIKPSDVVLIKSFDGYPGGILVLRVTTGNTEVRDQNFFLPDQGVELVEFADGTQWDRQYILANLQTSGGSVSNFVGTSGDDRYVVDNRDDSIVEAVNGGTDSVESSVSYALPDNVENLTLTGALSGDLTGNKLKNILVGNDSDNTLDWGGGGLDTLQGGAGNDTYTVLAPLSYEYHWPNLEESRELKVNIIESQNAGIDTLSTNAFYAKLADNLDNLKIVPSQVHTIHSSSQNPVVAKYLGNSLDNVLDASAVQTSILPIELDGQQGNDTLIGSNDDEDRASYRTAAAGVTVSLSIAGAQNTGSAGWDTLKSIEGLVGSAFNDVLTGNGGANVLDGGAGADRLAGGGGNDTYYADHVGDVIVEVAGGGSDTVYVSAIADYTMPDNVEHANVSMGRMPSVTVTGNDSGNSIVLIQGDSNGAQTAVVRGMGGNDTLTATRRGVELDGGGGDDLLIGGGFSGDVFIGGTGNDVYEISSDGGDDVIRANVVAVPAETNALRLKGVTRDKLSMQRQDGDLIIRSSDSQSARIEKFFGNAGTPGEFNPVQVLALDDGSNLDYSAISALVKSNAAPVVNEPMDPREVSDGEWFSWSIPSSAFTDDGGALTYTVALEDGTPLPGWASFDPSSGTISGSVHAGNDQTFRIKITAVDKEGLSASAVFVLAVRVDNKVLEGTANADTLLGGGGADILRGLDGKDQLQGDGGNDRLEGGAGDDSLFGQTGADILIGGLNNDYQSGGAGNDTFEYTKGDGQDTLDAVDVKTATDKLLIHGWLPSQVQLLRSGDHLFARMGSTDQIGFYNYFQAETVQDGAPADAKIDQIVFDNGDIWDQAKIATVLAGGGGNNGGGGTSTGPGNPPPSTYTYAYVLANQYSDYSLSGNAPYVFKGNSKANKLTGNDGANVINGAAGNDTLTGGKGGDTYFLEAGAGQDTIVENDTTLGIVDLLQWGSGIQHDQLWLRKAGNNLEISVIGKTDKAIVKDWYLGDSRHVEQIWANGKVLLDTKVQSLVDAMAAFSPPAAGQTTLPSNYQSALSPVLAANWQ